MYERLLVIYLYSVERRKETNWIVDGVSSIKMEYLQLRWHHIIHYYRYNDSKPRLQLLQRHPCLDTTTSLTEKCKQVKALVCYHHKNASISSHDNLFLSMTIQRRILENSSQFTANLQQIYSICELRVTTLVQLLTPQSERTLVCIFLAGSTTAAPSETSLTRCQDFLILGFHQL